MPTPFSRPKRSALLSNNVPWRLYLAADPGLQNPCESLSVRLPDLVLGYLSKTGDNGLGVVLINDIVISPVFKCCSACAEQD
jgi:hypothetical protein